MRARNRGRGSAGKFSKFECVTLQKRGTPSSYGPIGNTSGSRMSRDVEKTKNLQGVQYTPADHKFFDALSRDTKEKKRWDLTSLQVGVFPFHRSREEQSLIAILFFLSLKCIVALLQLKARQMSDTRHKKHELWPSQCQNSSQGQILERILERKQQFQTLFYCSASDISRREVVGQQYALHSVSHSEWKKIVLLMGVEEQRFLTKQQQGNQNQNIGRFNLSGVL